MPFFKQRPARQPLSFAPEISLFCAETLHAEKAVALPPKQLSAKPMLLLLPSHVC
jgi:hypothetical protein